MGEAGERGLVGHATRETERVDERLFVRVVRQEATPPKRGPEPRIMNGDDGLQPRRFVMLEVNLAVVVRLQVSKKVHASWLVARPGPASQTQKRAISPDQ